MPLVVFLRGANVGGSRVFSPAAVAKQLSRHDVINIGAAGTFVARSPVSAAMLRADLGKRLPFETETIVCAASEILGLVDADPFREPPPGVDVRELVTALARVPRKLPSLPIFHPAGEGWQLDTFRVVGRFALTFWRPGRRGLIYPDSMRDFGIPGTVRSYGTFLKISKVLRG
jgi:hypothetical protein